MSTTNSASATAAEKSAPKAVSFWTRALGSFSHTPRTLSLVWRAAPHAVVAISFLTILAALLPIGMAWVGKLVVDAVIAVRSSPAGPEHEALLGRVIHWVLLEFALILSVGLVERAIAYIRQIAGARLGIDLNLVIMEKALTLELRHFEDPKFYDKLTRARREASSRPLSLVQENFQIARSTLTLVGYAALLLRFSPIMVGGLLLAAVPAFISEARFSGAAFRLRNRRSPEARRLNYLEYVVANDEHAKEVKLFGLGPLLISRYRQLAELFFQDDRRLGRQRALWTFLLSIVTGAAYYSCYLVIALATARGRLSLGDMTLYIVAFRQGQNSFQGILSALSGMYEDNLYMSNLFEYLDFRPTAPRPPAPPYILLPSPETGLRFDHVGFRYPEAKRWALRNISLYIPRGASLALVGENGAGKTTFIKLLTRLYDPLEGRAFLDGRDLRDWDPAALRARVGVIFQDFNQYQFAVRENVGFGSVEHLTDEARLARAVERGGAREVVAGLANGLDTALGRYFHDGSELSGGQWQKLALARAFMREEADILVLDEPTAALDALAEQEIFERFRALTAGRTAILISHRFPTVRMADHIVVIADGQILEEGTHDALRAAHGKYAKMFELQAAGYR